MTRKTVDVMDVMASFLTSYECHLQDTEWDVRNALRVCAMQMLPAEHYETLEALFNKADEKITN